VAIMGGLAYLVFIVHYISEWRTISASSNS